MNEIAMLQEIELAEADAFGVGPLGGFIRCRFLSPLYCLPWVHLLQATKDRGQYI